MNTCQSVRFEVQQKCPLYGWNTWVIYDDAKHAQNECQRRIEESPVRDKNNWRVIKVQKQIQP